MPNAYLERRGWESACRLLCVWGQSQCVIDVSSEVGEHVAQVFTGIMINTLAKRSSGWKGLKASRWQLQRISIPERIGRTLKSIWELDQENTIFLESE